VQPEYPLNVADFAHLVGKSAATIRAGVRAGEIQHHRRGRRGWIFFTLEDHEAFLQATLVPAHTVAGQQSAAE